MSKRQPRKVFFGWWIVIVTGIFSGLSMLFYSQGASVFFKPIAGELGLDRTAASVASGIGAFVNTIMFAFAGWLCVKFGPKWVVFSGVCLTGAGMLLMRIVSSSTSYYLVWGIMIACGVSLGSSLAIDALVTNWFVRKRGLAFSLRWGLISIIGAALLPLLSWMVQTQGWRSACMTWGIMTLASSVVLLVFVKQKRPEYYQLLPDGVDPKSGTSIHAEALVATGKKYASDVQETEYTLKQALKTTSYWFITTGWIIEVVIVAGFNLHIIPFLTDRGIDPVAAGSLLALMIFFTLPARIFGGIIADRVRKDHLKFLLAGALFLSAIGIIIFLLTPTVAGLYILLVMYGLGYGSYTLLDTLIRGRFFGRKSYGSIQGLSMLLAAPLALLAPIYTGWIYDTTGTYTTAFTLFAVLAVIGGGVMCSIRIPGLISVENV